MAATFTSVVLGQPEIASMVFEFQLGVYEDVRLVFRACKELIDFDASRNAYVCDPSFRQAFAPNAEWLDDLGSITPIKYALRGNQIDPRLPLHLAVAGGFAQLTKRILGCRPDLASEAIIVLAFWTNHVEIADLLLHARETMPELSRRDMDQSSSVHCIYGKYFAKMLARDDSKGLLLLQRFGPRPYDLKRYDRRHAIQLATIENATLALDLFPWLVYLGLSDDVASRGFLPLVRSLHERGLECSSDAMDNAAANGHLEVVRFLHSHRREGCTVFAMDTAAANGHLDVVTLLHFHRTEGCTTKALDSAITNGHLDIVCFLIKHRTEGASPNILDEAATKGHLDVVRYLHSLGTFGCTLAAVDGAARFGHLKVVAFLLTNRSEGCSRHGVVARALAFGHLHTAEYLLSLGYPFPTSVDFWDENASRKPEMLGVVQLAIAQGRPFEKRWLLRACEVNNVPLVRFLYKYVQSDAAWRPRALHTAMWAKAWAVVRFLLANDTTDVAAPFLKQALRSGNLEAAAHILQCPPALGNCSLLNGCLNMEATRFLISVGDARDCLIELAGRRSQVTASKFLLPYCMDPADDLDNLIFLLDLVALPYRHRIWTRQLISQEVLDQGRKASQTIQLAPSLAARATTLLKAGSVVDWAFALVIGHLHATDATTTSDQLEKKIASVRDAELRAQLTRLVASKRKRPVCS
ncbi:hypothetical protein SPRG_06417 [Saprolegnia parasitica CBS 223.65]|uniref:Uncharacterized protein n=1 Tax=Saprolegnia parasitica (strain CBS 223.65) TaxID=695850 RepID=A0A067CCR9_SAPPC|nr:hypothetical protein SPRG_06417 [Saprolegnia parasitica CBS 223.65]KDO28559.1 hypothetical protein SPRG_06417 [Saprolegnia parasitica CBS 223.65]|eukprot:XP_012200624.1 hypothetical protein SPRG_06417 [Saprolegnia parasitica CBS 223.65]